MTGPAAVVSFRPDELEARDDGSGNLLGSHCRSCGAHFFPVRQACAGCLSTDLETVRLATEGVLYTYSLVRQSTPDFEVPYLLGYVDLPEGVRVLGQLGGCDIEELKIGMPMKLVLATFGTDKQGEPLTGYRFEPAGPCDD